MSGTRAAIYVRLSTDEQVKTSASLDTQEERCRQLANERELRVVNVFREEGYSGAVLDRPALSELRDLVVPRPGQPDFDETLWAGTPPADELAMPEEVTSELLELWRDYQALSPRKRRMVQKSSGPCWPHQPR